MRPQKVRDSDASQEVGGSQFLLIDFDDLDGLQTYLRHPTHEELGARFGQSLSFSGWCTTSKWGH